jgi:hypothetical protein
MIRRLNRTSAVASPARRDSASKAIRKVTPLHR